MTSVSRRRYIDIYRPLPGGNLSTTRLGRVIYSGRQSELPLLPLVWRRGYCVRFSLARVPQSERRSS